MEKGNYYLYPEYKASHLDPNFTRADEVKAGREKRVFTECAEVIAAGKLGDAKKARKVLDALLEADKGMWPELK